MALITCMMLLTTATAGQGPASSSLLIGPSPEATTGPSPEALQKNIDALNQKLREYERHIQALQAEVQNVAKAGWERERALVEQQKKLQRTLALTERAWREERATAAARAPVSSDSSRAPQGYFTHGAPTYSESTNALPAPSQDRFTTTSAGVTYYVTPQPSYVTPRQYIPPQPR